MSQGAVFQASTDEKKNCNESDWQKRHEHDENEQLQDDTNC